MKSAAECRAVCVPPVQVSEVLPLAQPMIRSAVSRCGDWTEAGIIAGLRKGDFLLWLAISGTDIDAAAVTELLQSEATGRYCNIILCGGRRLGNWAHLKSAIEQYAIDEQCARIRLSGRRGWARAFQDYRQPYITLEKVLI